MNTYIQYMGFKMSIQLKLHAGTQDVIPCFKLFIQELYPLDNAQ